MNINRRKFLRLNTDRQQCNVRLGIGESAGFVVDESIEGLRIGGLDLLILFADQSRRSGWAPPRRPCRTRLPLSTTESIVGRCRSVSRGDGGYFEVGIHREGDDYTEDPKSILLNTFMKFDGKSVTCVPMGVTQDDDVQIKLINGKEFTVSRDQIFQLCDDDTLAKVMQVYRLMDDANAFTSRTPVLDHEFGPAVRSLSAQG